MNHQFSQPTRPATKTPRWQIGLLLLMLLSFLGASYALLRPIPAANQLPPVLYLAEDEAGQLQLFIATAPNWQATQLTQETAVLLNYAASPDGSQIVYATSLPDGSSQLKRLPLNNNLAPGTPETLITCEIAECAQPVWHPDGRRLLYERREPPNFSRPQLWWLDTQTGETRLLLEKETAVGSSASFSPDGSWVAFAASPDEGLRLYNFTDGRSLVFASDLGTAVAWHPFQNQLLYQNRRAVVFHGEDDDNHDQHSHDFSIAISLYLATLDPTGTETSFQLLSEDGAFNDGNAAWSPGGNWIAFGRRLAVTNTGRQLWLMRADGSEAHALTDDIATYFGPPTWSPDGRFLLFQQYNSSTPDQPPSVWLLEIASGEFTQISNHGLLPTFLVHTK
ncbi:MAG: PD40 domain-containing protein [Ardenticatenaceae bacterium]|nr:PD40 domain-containing protein [Anaerolineales bacterium]MCB8941056.1 PD40 domain-containing protein [Ardenticatenaceae bacterium]MCB8972397.1 PD40 domain-containing protein [Ardenticatenaceae bacterium]